MLAAESVRTEPHSKRRALEGLQRRTVTVRVDSLGDPPDIEDPCTAANQDDFVEGSVGAAVERLAAPASPARLGR